MSEVITDISKLKFNFLISLMANKIPKNILNHLPYRLFSSNAKHIYFGD